MSWYTSLQGFHHMLKYVHVAGLILLLCVLMYALLRTLAPAPNSSPQSGTDHPHPQHASPSRMLYGLTIDDSWEGTRKLADIVEAIQRLPARPTVRIVMSED